LSGVMTRPTEQGNGGKRWQKIKTAYARNFHQGPSTIVVILSMVRANYEVVRARFGVR
jgi:hypothetical protein